MSIREITRKRVESLTASHAVGDAGSAHGFPIHVRHPRTRPCSNQEPRSSLIGSVLIYVKPYVALTSQHVTPFTHSHTRMFGLQGPQSGEGKGEGGGRGKEEGGRRKGEGGRGKGERPWSAVLRLLTASRGGRPRAWTRHFLADIQRNPHVDHAVGVVDRLAVHDALLAGHHRLLLFFLYLWPLFELERTKCRRQRPIGPSYRLVLVSSTACPAEELHRNKL